MSGRWSAFLEAQGWSGSRKLFLTVMGRKETGRAQRFVIAPLTLVPLAEGVAYDVPTLGESYEEVQDALGDVTGFLQAIVDLAWDNGFRPSGFKDHTNELTAVRYHLEDMRQLAKLAPRK